MTVLQATSRQAVTPVSLNSAATTTAAIHTITSRNSLRRDWVAAWPLVVRRKIRYEWMMKIEENASAMFTTAVTDSTWIG